MTENKEYSWKPKNEVLLFHMKRKLVDQEHVVIVDKSRYDWFINLSDEAMVSVMKLIIKAQAKEINRKLWAPSDDEDKIKNEINDFVLTLLWFVAQQTAHFNLEEQALTISHPIGGAPTPEQDRLIDEKIEKSRDLVGVAIWDLMKSTEQGQKIKRDIEDDIGGECEIRSVFQMPQVKQSEENPKPNNKSIFGTVRPSQSRTPN